MHHANGGTRGKPGNKFTSPLHEDAKADAYRPRKFRKRSVLLVSLPTRQVQHAARASNGLLGLRTPSQSAAGVYECGGAHAHQLHGSKQKSITDMFGWMRRQSGIATRSIPERGHGWVSWCQQDLRERLSRMAPQQPPKHYPWSPRSLPASVRRARDLELII